MRRTLLRSALLVLQLSLSKVLAEPAITAAPSLLSPRLLARQTPDELQGPEYLDVCYADDSVCAIKQALYTSCRSANADMEAQETCRCTNGWAAAATR